jgi:hypothetical protein
MFRTQGFCSLAIHAQLFKINGMASPAKSIFRILQKNPREESIVHSPLFLWTPFGGGFKYQKAISLIIVNPKLDWMFFLS